MGLLNEIPKPISDKTGWPWDQETPEEIYSNRTYWPKISIVTPSYNQGIFLEETIRSILLQNYPNLEYTVIDGGSNDNSVSTIKKYENWIYYWVSEPDRGQSNAINKGVEKSTGEIVAWLNSDDYYEPYAFYNTIELYDRDGVDFIIGGLNVIEQNRVIDRLKATWISRKKEITIGYSELSQPSSFWTMKVMKTYGPLNEQLHYLMDQEFWIRYLLSNKDFRRIRRTDKTLANFRIHQSSKTKKDTPLFNYEKANIYYTLAKNINNEKHLKKISAISNFNLQSLDSLKNANISTYSLRVIVNYYILRLVRRNLEIGNRKEAKALFNYINPFYLSIGDAFRTIKLLYI